MDHPALWKPAVAAPAASAAHTGGHDPDPDPDGALTPFLAQHSDLYRVHVGLPTAAEAAAEAALAAAAGPGAAAEVASTAGTGSPAAAPMPDEDTLQLVRAHEPALRGLQALAGDRLADITAVLRVEATRSLWPSLADADAAALADLEAAAGYWGITRALSSDRLAQEEAARRGFGEPPRRPAAVLGLLEAAVAHVLDAVAWADEKAAEAQATCPPTVILRIHGAALLGRPQPPAAPVNGEQIPAWAPRATWRESYLAHRILAGHRLSPQQVAHASQSGLCVYAAAHRGDAGLLSALLDPLATGLSTQGPSLAAHAIRGAAAGGRPCVLEWLSQHRRGASLGLPYLSVTLSRALGAAAGHGGSVGMLDWLTAHNFDWAFDGGVAAREAARAGHVAALQWLQARGADVGADSCAAAADAGRLDTLMWLRARGCPWDESTLQRAAAGGHSAVLEWAAAHGCPLKRP